ncbi:MAG TPA: outer membrane protein assembly factor BamE [Opitutaceae bacterium]|nr:outer membrane protein assembly factor BamE [Opitutaceae bacterium]
MKSKRCLYAVGVGLAVTLGGCESTPQSANGPEAASGVALIAATKVDQLTPGLTAGQVIELLGTPLRRTPFSAPGLPCEVWVYRLDYHDAVSQVPVATQDQPFVDPVTGQSRGIPALVYQNEFVRTYRTLELLMVGGRFTERKTSREVERSFH